jgi:hypothetical protein
MVMKKLTPIPEEILLEYLDGTLERGKKEAVDNALMESPALRERLEELRKADDVLRQLTPDQPSKNFTATLMNRLDEYPVRRGLSIRNGILLLSGIVIVMAIAVLLLSLGAFDKTTTLNPNNIGVVDQYIDKTLPSISIDGKMVINVIILLNLALIFVVLDRAILKPIFQKRLQTGH